MKLEKKNHSLNSYKVKALQSVIDEVYKELVGIMDASIIDENKLKGLQGRLKEYVSESP